jgi:mitogen-activated protein kinase kinase
MLEIGTGKYPYPLPNKKVGVFAQLSAIVKGVPPSLPEDEFSAECRDFVAQW